VPSEPKETGTFRSILAHGAFQGVHRRTFAYSSHPPLVLCELIEAAYHSREPKVKGVQYVRGLPIDLHLI
jgi:hypothetical protein